MLNYWNHLILDAILKKNKIEEQKQFLRFVAKGTPNNQLFLTEINTRKVKENVSNINDLLNALDWFQNSLKVIFPEDKYNEGVKYELQENSKLLYDFSRIAKNILTPELIASVLRTLNQKKLIFPQKRIRKNQRRSIKLKI